MIEKLREDPEAAAQVVWEVNTPDYPGNVYRSQFAVLTAKLNEVIDAVNALSPDLEKREAKPRILGSGRISLVVRSENGHILHEIRASPLIPREDKGMTELIRLSRMVAEGKHLTDEEWRWWEVYVSTSLKPYYPSIWERLSCFFVRPCKWGHRCHGCNRRGGVDAARSLPENPEKSGSGPSSPTSPAGDASE